MDVSCDTLAKDETVRVYALTPHSWFDGVGDRGNLLFEYDPGGPQKDLPQITAVSGGTLTISIPWVSSIYYKADQWNGRMIRYQIRRVDYP